MFLTFRHVASLPAHKSQGFENDHFRPVVGAQTNRWPRFPLCSKGSNQNLCPLNRIVRRLLKVKGFRRRETSHVARFQMGDVPLRSSSESDEDVPILPGKKPSHQKLSILPLIFLIFYEVSGGPFGIEDTVQAGGPLLALLGFLLFPLIWSVPEALITAEMGTMFPENSGYVIWISEAFGPFWGFQQGWWKWLSGVIDNALYPVLFLDYLKFAIPAVSGGPVRVGSVLVITTALTYLNYRGLTIVGWASVGLGMFTLLPFGVMVMLSLPHLKPSRWFVVDFARINWNTYLNTLFWNLNYWDSVSTLVGEVDNPQRTLPKALFYAVLLVVGGYFIPLLAGTGSVDLVRSKWNDGYLADIAIAVGGAWLSWWMEASAALSNMGMFEAEMSSDSFQLLGMAERGMLPKVFAARSVYGTPTVGILASATGVLLLSWMSFQEIIAAENTLYCFGMFAEFVAFVWLRIHRPEISRPYKIPLGTVGVILMCVPPAALLVVVMIFQTWKVIIVSFAAAIVGFGLYPCLLFLQQKKWIEFSSSPEVSVNSVDEMLDPQESKCCADKEMGLRQ